MLKIMIRKSFQRSLLWIFLALVTGILTGKTTQAQDRQHPGADREVRMLLAQFLKPKANTRALTLALRPTRKDIFTYFKKNAAQKALTYYRDMWMNMDKGIRPRHGQNRFLIVKATVKELKNGTGKSSLFPGGYKKVAHLINEGFTIYRFKFVRNNSKFGMAVDGLVFVNGRWVFFPKPWKALGL